LHIRLSPPRDLLPEKLIRNVKLRCHFSERVRSLRERAALHVAPMNLCRRVQPSLLIPRDPRGETEEGLMGLAERSLTLQNLPVQRGFRSCQRLSTQIGHLPKQVVRRGLCHSRQVPNVAVFSVDK